GPAQSTRRHGRRSHQVTSEGLGERTLELERPLFSHTPSEPAILVEHLVRRFGARTVLHNVSLSVDSNQAFGLIGANGSGKTVLLRLIASLDRPTSGRVAVHGYDTLRRPRAVRDRVGYVPEEPM